MASITTSQTVTEGQVLTLTVSVNGSTPFTYQWQFEGVAISGATQGSFALNPVRVASAGSYRVVISNAGGSTTSGPILVNVIPATLPSLYYSQSNYSIEQGGLLNLNVYLSSNSAVTYQWYKDSVALVGATASNYSKAVAQASDAGIYYVVATNIAGSATSGNMTVMIPAPVAPTIAGLSSSTLDAGGYLSLYPSISGSLPITYQWYKDGIAIPNATSYAYSKSPVTISDAGSYTVTAINRVGSTTSSPVTLTVRAPVAPTISSQSPGGIVRSGESLSLSVGASGTNPLTYQWKKDGVVIANATSSSYYKSPVQASDVGSYIVTVTNEQGSVASAAMAITVTSLRPPQITSHPPSVAIYAGGSLDLSASYTGSSPLSFQWKKNGVDIPGANSSYYSKSSFAAADAGTYSLVVTNPAGTATSEGAIVTALAAVLPTIDYQPSGGTFVQGSSFSLNVTAGGYPSPTFQWRKDGVAIVGATSSSYSKGNLAASDGGDYTVVATNSAGSVTSSVARISVGIAETPRITAHPASASLLPGDSFSGISVQVANSDSTTFQWKKDGVVISGATSSTYYIYSAQPSNAGSYTVDVTSAGGSATSSPGVITVDTSVNRPPIVYTPGSFVTTTGNYFSLQISTAPGIAPSVQWRKDGVPIPNATSTSYYLGSFTPSMAGTYSAAVTTPGGTTVSLPIVVSQAQLGIAPIIRRQPASSLIGSYNGFQVVAEGEQPLSYQWKKSGTSIPGAISSSYSPPGTADGVGTYSVAVTNRLGTVESESATWAFPASNASVPVISRHPQSQTLAAGGYFSLGVTVLGSGSGFTYQWKKDGVAINGATSSSYYNFSDTSAAAGRYLVVVTNSSGSTTSYEAVVTVAAQPTGPTFTSQPGNASVYSGTNVTLGATATASSGALIYQWRKNGNFISGATASSLTLANVTAADAGDYDVIATDAIAAKTSTVATVEVMASLLPTFTVQPSGTAVQVGQPATFSSTATGTPAPTYQWSRNGTAISGATSPSLTLASVQASDGGTYTVRANNSAGTATSNGAVLTVYSQPLAVPAFIQQPSSVNAAPGGTVSFTVTVSGYPTPTLQWRKDGTSIPGATSTTLTLANVQATHAGSYTAIATNAAGSATSNVASLFLGNPFTGSYFGDVAGGGAWALLVRTDGTARLLAILPAQNQVIALEGIVDLGGAFSFGGSQAAGVDSDPLAARYYRGAVTGSITTGGISGIVPGLGLSMSGTSGKGSGTSAWAQEYHGVGVASDVSQIEAIAGRDGQLFVVVIEAQSVHGGTGTLSNDGRFNLNRPDYSVTGSLAGTGGTLSGTYTPATGTPITLATAAAAGGLEHLANVSTRGLAGSDAKTMIAGFVIRGDKAKDVLIRAIGPSLGKFGVPGVLTDPKLLLYRDSTLIYENDNWSTNASSTLNIQGAATRLGAFALAEGTNDAALLVNLEPGSYTGQVTSANAQNGVALIEVYDATESPGGDMPKLVNLSTRAEVGTGGDILIVGVVVTGNAPKRLLLRAVGPTLGTFGVNGVLADPKLSLYQGNNQVRENDNWSAGPDAALITETTQNVGAFALPGGSKDAAMVVYLAPGNYTAQVSGKDGTTGVTLLEVYEVP